jgi:hypothetical protein
MPSGRDSQAQYAMAGDQDDKTMVDDIMDLDEVEPRDQPRFQKFIRQRTSARNIGIMGGGMDPLRNLSPRIQPMMHDPTTQQTYPSGPPLNPSQTHPSYKESYEKDHNKAMMKEVINRIFNTTSDFAEALDNGESPMHNVAKSFLLQEVGCVDKTVYIAIIAILIFSVACLLWRLYKKTN